MIYKVTAETFTKINERTGTLQNTHQAYSVEMSNNANFDNSIIVYPLHKHTFSNTAIYLRCINAGEEVEVRVIPFEIDVGSGGGSSTTVISGGDSATDEEVDAMLDDILPTIQSGN